jgi:hypothetical protein
MKKLLRYTQNFHSERSIEKMVQAFVMASVLGTLWAWIVLPARRMPGFNTASLFTSMLYSNTSEIDTNNVLSLGRRNESGYADTS